MKSLLRLNEEFLNMVGSEFGVSGIDTWLTIPALASTLNLQWDRLTHRERHAGISIVPTRTAEDARRRRKRSRRQVESAYVVSFQDFSAYLKRIQARVGWRKSAWASFLSTWRKGCRNGLTATLPHGS
jgi:hypothetical protein